MKNDTVTCSFVMDRNIYNAYKGIVASNGENVKGNLVKYMQKVIKYETPNPETIAAIEAAESSTDTYGPYNSEKDLMEALNT